MFGAETESRTQISGLQIRGTTIILFQHNTLVGIKQHFCNMKNVVGYYIYHTIFLQRYW